MDVKLAKFSKEEEKKGGRDEIHTKKDKSVTKKKINIVES